jgi:ATP-dependent Clp protease ATP-binding subunit ClpA
MQPTDPGKFTDKAWEAIVKSQDVARKYRNQQLEVEHLAIALLEEDETTTLLLERAGADPAALLNASLTLCADSPASPPMVLTFFRTRTRLAFKSSRRRTRGTQRSLLRPKKMHLNPLPNKSSAHNSPKTLPSKPTPNNS